MSLLHVLKPFLEEYAQYMSINIFVSACGGQKRVVNSLEILLGAVSHMCWEPTVGPLEEQEEFLTIELCLWPLSNYTRVDSNV